MLWPNTQVSHICLLIITHFQVPLLYIALNVYVVFNVQEGKYAIVTDRWQKFSDVYLDKEILDFLANYADEFLVHGVDVEGKK